MAKHRIGMSGCPDIGRGVIALARVANEWRARIARIASVSGNPDGRAEARR